MRNKFSVITFDDLQGQQALPLNYAGFKWIWPPVGTQVASGPLVGGYLVFCSDAPNSQSGPVPLTMSSESPFDFIGMSAACTNTAPDNMLTVEGWRGKRKLYSERFEVHRNFKFHVFAYFGVDTIMFYSSHELAYIDNIVVARGLFVAP